MARKNLQVLQEQRDVERASREIADRGGLTPAQGARALGARATDAGISLHAAALAAMSTGLPNEWI